MFPPATCIQGLIIFQWSCKTKRYLFIYAMFIFLLFYHRSFSFFCVYTGCLAERITDISKISYQLTIHKSIAEKGKYLSDQIPFQDLAESTCHTQLRMS